MTSRRAIVCVEHRLDKAEALARLRTELEKIRPRLGNLVKIEQERWTSLGLEFQLFVFGQFAWGVVEIDKGCVRVNVILPRFLGRSVQGLEAAIRQHAERMLQSTP